MRCASIMAASVCFARFSNMGSARASATDPGEPGSKHGYRNG